VKIVKTCVLVLLIFFNSEFCSGQVFVNLNATGASNESSWENAFTDLQNALSVAEENDQIWIAAGI
jgi:hypothetical protein